MKETGTGVGAFTGIAPGRGNGLLGVLDSDDFSGRHRLCQVQGDRSRAETHIEQTHARAQVRKQMGRAHLRRALCVRGEDRLLVAVGVAIVRVFSVARLSAVRMLTGSAVRMLTGSALLGSRRGSMLEGHAAMVASPASPVRRGISPWPVTR